MRRLVPVVALGCLLLSADVMARQWCFGNASMDKDSGRCTGSGWAVEKEPADADYIDCFLRSTRKGSALILTADSILFIGSGVKAGAAGRNVLQVDDEAPLAADLIVPGQGLEFADKHKRELLIGQFKKGLKARLELASRKVWFSLVGFSKGLQKFQQLCAP